MGREAQQGGEVHPSGGTDSSLAAAAPTLEVQHVIRHAVRVSQGRALTSNTTIIAPNPALLSPPPQVAYSLPGPGPSGALTLGVRRAIAAACEKARGGAVPSHHSPCCSKSAPHPTPQLQVPVPAALVQPTPKAAAGAGVGQAATEPPLPQQRLLSEVPLSARGARWQLRQKPYVPWNPSQTQFWEAHRLLTGQGEWAAPKCVFVPEGNPLCRGPKSSSRWVCGHGSCQKLVSSQLDGRGHYQSTHLGGQVTSLLCSCGITFSSCTTLTNHLDIQHNVHHAGVSKQVPTVYLIYLDRPAHTPTFGPVPPSISAKTRPSPPPHILLLLFCKFCK